MMHPFRYDHGPWVVIHDVRCVILIVMAVGRASRTGVTNEADGQLTGQGEAEMPQHGRKVVRIRVRP